MKFLVTGGNGFIGKAIREVLQKKNHQIQLLSKDEIEKGSDIIDKVEWSDVIINLAGANISKRWNKAYKKIIYDSRINTTKMLVDAISKATNKPSLLISASAVGFYNDESEYDEEHFLPTNNFLGDLCSDWETMAMRASKNTRVVVFRFGVVLGRNGGIIKKLYPMYKNGLGAIIGSGKQSMSWIHISDVLNAVQYALKNKNLAGIYNLCSPNNITQKEFSKVFASSMHRPLFFRIPAFLIKLMFGEGSIVLLEGQRVKPNKLLNEGFNFKHTYIKSALMDIIDSKQV